MISKMNKLTMLVYHKEYNTFLETLRDAGVVHIAERNSGVAENEEIQELISLSGRYTKLIKKLERIAGEDAVEMPKDIDTLLLADNLDEMLLEAEHLKQELQIVMKDATTMSVWGDFDNSILEKLSKAGYVLNFYVTSIKGFNETWVNDYNAIVVKQQSSRLYFVTVTPVGEVVDIDAEIVKLPSKTLSELNSEIVDINNKIKSIENKIKSFATENIESFRVALKNIQQNLEFSQVKLNGEMVSGDKLVLLEGWVPEDNVAELKSLLDSSAILYDIRLVHRGDDAPVKLKNNAYTRMYEVLTKMYGMPSGTDFDPTPILAPFFSLFFAFCMGDAGYGLILILLGLILKKKLGKSMAGMMNLVITLGAFTTVIGAFLGTFFGMSLIDSNIPETLKEFIIAGKIELFGSEYDKQMILALAIGVVHISIAMTVKAINTTFFFGFKESISAWGWWLVVVGGAIVGILSFLSIIPAEVSKWILIVGGAIAALGIYVLNNLRRNVFVNVGAGLWDTYNMASGLLGDILSYIRLFALGLAGGMLGQTFNSLALMVVEGREGVAAILGWIGFGLIIIIGHTLNIAMSCLSAFVHPLRLTFVEYFKNAGYDGKGVEYKPFKKR